MYSTQSKGLVLVTGGAGYIGCVLVPLLLERGYSVRVFDKLFFGDEGLRPVKDRIEIVQGDMRSFDKDVLEDVFGVIDLGGLSNDPTANFNPVANYHINTVATEVIVDACKSKGIKRFTFASSASLYDRGLDAPDILQDEESEINPIAPYSTSNFESERIMFHMMDDNFMPCSLRQGTVYGYSPRMRYDLVVNTFLKDAIVKGEINVHNGGEMWRPLVDVRDTALAHIACLEAPLGKVGGQVFNIVFRNYRILELAHYVSHCLKNISEIKINVEYSDRPNRSYRLSADKITRSLGFKPKISVQESLRDMVERVVGKQDNNELLHPKHYNINWMSILHETEKILSTTGSIF
jgi:nucleoside-diphosphate-sugar epimerase